MPVGDRYERKARKFGVPGRGQVVKLPGIEVLHHWMEQNGMEVVGWRGDVLVVRKKRPQSQLDIAAQLGGVEREKVEA